MRKRWARWLALLTGMIVVLISAAFAAIQNPAATAAMPPAASSVGDDGPALVARAQIVLRLENGRIEEVRRGPAPQDARAQQALVERRVAERRSSYR